MDSLRDIARFKSDHFVPVLPEDSQVNPGVYGAELAFWLSAELARASVVTSYPNAEDWGWFIEFLPESGSEFAVHCGNEEGARDRWLLSLRRHARKMFGRDKPPFEEASKLIAAIRALLTASPYVQEMEWLYDQDQAA
jgi:hypothetical protein